MNKAKWCDLTVPLTILALKLCEEAGEVSGEVTDAHFRDGGFSVAEGHNINSVIEELDHTIFIAQVMRDRLVNLVR